MRSEGYIHLTGSAKDMIIRGGENIYPREIEEFLYTNPKVAEVQVVGLPYPRLGEIALAWIRLRAGKIATESEIREFCDGKIAHFKIPKHPGNNPDSAVVDPTRAYMTTGPTKVQPHLATHPFQAFDILPGLAKPHTP